MDAANVDRRQDLPIFSLTLLQRSYRVIYNHYVPKVLITPLTVSDRI